MPTSSKRHAAPIGGGGDQLEHAIQSSARHLFSLVEEDKGSLLTQERLQSEVMDWAMGDERLKVEMFRFVDVFPMLEARGDIARHLREYFLQEGVDPPRTLRWALTASGPHSPLLPIAAATIRRQMLGMARRFIVGRDARTALGALERLREQDMGFTLDVLGEASVSAGEAAAYQARYLDLLDILPQATAAWPEVPLIDHAPWGPLPRVNVSIKVTSLDSQIDPLDYEGSVRVVKDALRPVFRKARDSGAFVNLDLEQFRYRDLTFATFTELLDENEFRDFSEAGVVVQAYLRDAERDLRTLIEWARRRGVPVTVRLVKGAYWDYETVLARQEGWPVPVFTHKPDTDVNFERLVRIMLDNVDIVRPAFASHNVRSLGCVIATAHHLGMSDDAYEIQMLHGMGEPVKHAVRRLGLRLREYTPVGEMLPGMAYLVRRLLENTANESFLRRSFVEGTDVEELVAAPQASPDFATPAEMLPAVRETVADDPPPFRNQPKADFSRDVNRRSTASALALVRARLGAEHPLLIDGKAVTTREKIVSTDPSMPSRVVGVVSCGGVAEAEAAVAAAKRAFAGWRDAPARERAQVLFRAAEIMRRELAELAALETYECAKPIREADGDVGEAIDFLEYYGREALRLERPRRMGALPGELNHYFYEPRGVAVTIAPWNFPLAIVTGMTAAALAAGNSVVVKPAGPSPVIAAQLVRILTAAGAPPGTINYLPSSGAVAGETLVCHPDVHIIAFTGSREIGLHILERAATHPGHSWVKRVIAEMGGKNAVIVDDDADLDVAVLEIVQSAFGYAGQKCSACSRVVVLDQVHDEFVERLSEAVRSLAVGAADDPATRVPAVITAQAKERIEEYIEQGRQEARLVVGGDAPAGGWPDGGHYVAPHVFVDVDPGAVIAQEEIFGPVLAVLRAGDFSRALEIALDSQYALTGGLISRSPAHIARARREFRVGNLYINRGITGAMVERQAFGGFRMSGVGSKAGGPDYVTQFMEPRVVTENTLRRGFAPPEPDDL